MGSFLLALKKANQYNVNSVFDLALQDENKRSLAMANFAQAISNYTLQDVDPISIATAIVQMTNLGFSASTGESYIIPYGKNAKFQLGYKALISLALRSGQIIKLNAAPIYEGEFKGYNRLKDEYIFETKEVEQSEDKIIGYVGYLMLKSGFEKTIYWTKEQLHKHFCKFSKNNYDEEKRRWMENKKTGVVSKILDVDKKSKITMMKQIISQWAPKDASMDLALKVDGSTYTSEGETILAKNDNENLENTKRVIADKDLIMETLNIVGAIAKEKNLVKNMTESKAWATQKGKLAGIDFGISSGWYGVTKDELKAFCLIVEKELETEIVVNGVRLSQEKPEAEKEIIVDLDD